MTSFGQKDAVPMPSRCRCGHNLARHQVAGFDGECIGDGCQCTGFNPIAPANPGLTPRPVRTPAPVPPSTIEATLTAAQRCGDRRTELVAEKVRAELDEIRHRLGALAAKARAEEIKSRMPARPTGPGEHACTRDGCDRTFTSPQARAMHERRAHDGFNPQAAHHERNSA